MRPIMNGIVAIALLATAVDGQSPRYVLKDPGTLPGGTFSQASDLRAVGEVVAGISAGSDSAQHGVLWIPGRPVDIVGQGLGGPNSSARDSPTWRRSAKGASPAARNRSGSVIMVMKRDLMDFGKPSVGGVCRTWRATSPDDERGPGFCAGMVAGWATDRVRAFRDRDGGNLRRCHRDSGSRWR
jgi:hypothetical protein